MTHNSEAIPATPLTADEVDRLQSALPIERFHEIFDRGTDTEKEAALFEMTNALKADPALLVIARRVLIGCSTHISPWIELQKAIDEVTGEMA